MRLKSRIFIFWYRGIVLYLLYQTINMNKTVSNESLKTASHYHILEDGTVVSSRQPQEIGNRYQKPGTNNFLKIKFTMTNAEFTVVYENSKRIIEYFNQRKAQIARERTGWNSVVIANLQKELYQKFVVETEEEPLMRESVFFSLPSCNK